MHTKCFFPALLYLHLVGVVYFYNSTYGSKQSKTLFSNYSKFYTLYYAYFPNTIKPMSELCVYKKSKLCTMLVRLKPAQLSLLMKDQCLLYFLPNNSLYIYHHNTIQLSIALLLLLKTKTERYNLFIYITVKFYNQITYARLMPLICLFFLFIFIPLINT